MLEVDFLEIKIIIILESAPCLVALMFHPLKPNHRLKVPACLVIIRTRLQAKVYSEVILVVLQYLANREMRNLVSKWAHLRLQVRENWVILSHCLVEKVNQCLKVHLLEAVYSMVSTIDDLIYITKI